MPERYELIEPTIPEKIYLVLSVALATVCFFGSLAQAAAQLHHKLTRGPQMVLHLSHALLGMLTALNVIYPIKSISQPPPSRPRASLPGFLGSEHACLLLSAGLLLLTLTAGCLHALLLLLHQLLRSARLGCLPLLQTAGGWLWPALVATQWLLSVALAVLPAAGWSRWAGVCHLPGALAPGQLVLTAALLGACCLLGAALLVTAIWARRGARPAADQSPIGGGAASSATSRHYDSLLTRPPAAGLRLAAAHLAAATLSTAAVLTAALAAPADTALGLLRWAALLLVLARLLVTVATMFCEDALSSAVLAWLRAVCCCCHGNNAVHPVATTGDDPAHTELDDNFEI